MSIHHESRTDKTTPMQNGLVGLCAVGTVLLIWWLLKFSNYGIDFTDESYYLVWIANPFIYDGSITQFGFVYHPLYKLLGGDIAALRQANILITFALAWGLAYAFLASLAVEIKDSRITLPVVSASLATSAFIIFDSWLVTPSYNTLNLQALLITTTGVVLANCNVDRKSISGWLLIGVGGWLALMAKPSTTLALAVGVLIYLIFSRKYSIRMLALTTTSALVLLSISALLIDGSLVGFVNRLQIGIEFSKILGGGHTLSRILRIDEFQISTDFKFSILLVAGAVFFAHWSICAKNKKWQIIGVLISISFFSITALLTLGQVQRAAGLGQFQGLLIFGVVYAAVISTLPLGLLRALKSVTSQQWLMAVLLLAMPHVYAFGSNNNYWKAGGSAAIFWLLAGITLLGPTIREYGSWKFALPTALAAQAVTATLLQTGLEQPYRQNQPLMLNSSIAEFGINSSKLVLSDGYVKYLTEVNSVVSAAGFKPETPMIDLTGQSPGILYSIGAENIGQAWTIGGYPGSLELAEVALLLTSCEKISEAWILFEEDGPRSISSELMHKLGADFPKNFEEVGSSLTASGAGGYDTPRLQILYKPIKKQNTLMNCQNLREVSKR